MELQIPTFDLGIDAESGLKFAFAASDGYGNSDSTDISDLSRNVESQEECIEADRKKANGEYTGNLIMIDGSFDDWEQNANLKSDNDDSFDANVDIIRYANLTEDSGDTFYYVNVEGAILGGSNFIEKESRIRGKSPNYDIALEDNEIPKTYNVPVLNGQDQIFVFIDSDYNLSTGYMSESIGADKLIEIRGQYGVITSSTISTYNPNPEIENDWNWIGKTDTPAANDENEIEILGETGDYYLYIESWDADRDEIEPEIYNRIDLPDDETAKDGSRGSVSWPSSWTTIVTDGDDGVNTDVEILTLQFASDTDHLYFRIGTEADVDTSDSTFGILINDVSNGGQTNEAACHTRQTDSGSDRGYVSEWDGGWYVNNHMGSSHIRVNHGAFSGIDLACDKAFLGFSYSSGDEFAAVSGDSGDNEFMNSWLEENTPTGGSGMDDITAYSAIPEFSSLLMPIASVVMIVGYNKRLKRKYSNQH
jgi:hypothetical protein